MLAVGTEFREVVDEIVNGGFRSALAALDIEARMKEGAMPGLRDGLIWSVNGDYVCIAEAEGDPHNILRLLRDSEIGRGITARGFDSLSSCTLRRVKDLLASLEDISQKEGAMLHFVRNRDGSYTIGDETYHMFSDFQFYRKIKPIKAVRMGQPFKVDTFEGTVEGKEGDYLIEGVHGELYPCDAAVFAESYAVAGRCQAPVEWVIYRNGAQPAYSCTKHLSRMVHNAASIITCEPEPGDNGCQFIGRDTDG